MLNLVTENEKLSVTVAGAKFFYKRPALADSALVNQYMKKAREQRAKDLDAGKEPDPLLYEKAMIKAYLTGWDGVGEADKPLAYAPELVDRLPYEQAVELAQKLGIIKRLEESKKKPSSPSSSSTPRPASPTPAKRAKSAKKTR